MFQKLKALCPVAAPTGSVGRIYLVASLVLAVCAGANAADSPLAAAAAREDWPGVVSAAAAGGAPGQFLRAHALLALGNSGASMCEFVSVASPEALRAWDNWTASFLKLHERDAVARYLRGDFLARAGRYDEAMTQFSGAVKVRPAFFLALNARGVLLAGRGEFDRALLDFIAASRANTGFADAHLNRGFYYVQTRQSVAGARNAFSRALTLSPNSGLPRLGLAQLELAAGDPARADEGMATAARDCSCLSALIRDDRARIVQWIVQRSSPRKLTASEAGTEVRTVLQDAMKTGDPVKFAKGMQLAQGNKDAEKYVKDVSDSYQKLQGDAAKKVIAKAADIYTKTREDDTVRLQKLQTQQDKLTANVDFNLGSKKLGVSAGGGAGAEITGNSSIAAKDALDKLAASKSFADDMKKLGTKTSGVRSDDIAFALVDKGEWPLVPHYALQYAAAGPGKASGK